MEMFVSYCRAHLDQVEPETSFQWEEKRPASFLSLWDCSRVLHFANLLREGRDIDHIDVMGYYLHSGPSIELYDGYHRLTAHVIAEQDWVPAEYSGHADTYNYLTGQD